MLLITHAKGGKQRYVPLLPDLTHELRTSYGQKTRTRLDSRVYDPAMAQASACLLSTLSCILDAK